MSLRQPGVLTSNSTLLFRFAVYFVLLFQNDFQGEIGDNTTSQTGRARCLRTQWRHGLLCACAWCFANRTTTSDNGGYWAVSVLQTDEFIKAAPSEHRFVAALLWCKDEWPCVPLLAHVFAVVALFVCTQGPAAEHLIHTCAVFLYVGVCSYASHLQWVLCLSGSVHVTDLTGPIRLQVGHVVRCACVRADSSRSVLTV